VARIIAIAVPKGGTSKTTTTLNLGAALAELGKRVLLVDFDPQGNLTQALGVRRGEQDPTIYSVIKDFLSTYEPSLDHAITQTQLGLDLVPANELLNLANAELTVAMNGQTVLQQLLEPVEQRYDVILIDTLPYLGILVVNALVAAREILIPLQAEFLATTSVSLILRQVEMMRRSKLNPELQVLGILLTMVDQRTVITRETIDYARQTYGSRVFETMIKRSIRVVESQANRQSILQYDPQGEVARAYRALAEEVLRAQQA
jgi:chromosome partitioning protein